MCLGPGPAVGGAPPGSRSCGCDETRQLPGLVSKLRPGGAGGPSERGADTSGGFLGVYRAADGWESPGRTRPLGDSMAQVTGAGTRVLRCPAACSPGAAWVTRWREQLPIPSWAPPAAESTVGAWPWPVSARGGHRGQPELCTHVLTATLHVLLRPTLPGVYSPY